MAVVAVPFVRGMLRAVIPRATREAWPNVEYLALDPTDAGAYALALERLWRRGEALVVVEHDVVVPDGAISRLLACPHPWCSHCYVGDQWPQAPMLGLVAFSSDLVTGTAEVGVHVLRTSARHITPVPWRIVDTVISRHLTARGWPWHRHSPEVEHLHADEPLRR